MINILTATISELTAFWNQHCHPDKVIKKFANKTTAQRRVQQLINQQAPPAVLEPKVKGPPKPEAFTPFLNRRTRRFNKQHCIHPIGRPFPRPEKKSTIMLPRYNGASPAGVVGGYRTRRIAATLF